MSSNMIYLGNPYSNEIRGRYPTGPSGVEAQGSKVTLSYTSAPLPPVLRFFQDIPLEKADVLKQAYPTFTDVYVEDFQNAPYGNADLANCTKVGLSQYEVSLDVGGFFVSNSYTLPYAPTKFMILVDCFRLIEEDSPGDYYRRKYEEYPADGVNTIPFLDFTGVLPVNGYAVGTTQVLAPILQGTDFVFSLSNGLSQKLYITGWSLLFAPLFSFVLG